MAGRLAGRVVRVDHGMLEMRHHRRGSALSAEARSPWLERKQVQRVLRRGGQLIAYFKKVWPNFLELPEAQIIVNLALLFFSLLPPTAEEI
jgi:hypothetical protein